MIRKAAISIVAIVACCGALLPSAEAAAPAPAWTVYSLAAPTVFAPGSAGGRHYYQNEFINSGAIPTDGSPVILNDTLPRGVAVKTVELKLRVKPWEWQDFAPTVCATEVSGGVSTVTCTVTEGIGGTTEPATLPPGEQYKLIVDVEVPSLDPGSRLTNLATVTGGGAGEAAYELETQVGNYPAPGGFSQFTNEVTGPDGRPITSAGSHPYQYTTSFAANTRLSSDGKTMVGSSGILKNINVALPPGFVGNPTATPRCSAKDFSTTRLVIEEGHNSFISACPADTAVGVISLRQFEGLPGDIGPIYNLVPTKGMPAQLGFAAAGTPIYIDTEVRSGADYGVDAHIRNASEAKRVTAATVTLWGNPYDASHDPVRGYCSEIGNFEGPCVPPPGPAKAFLRLPTSCGDALPFGMSFDTWDMPGALIGAQSLQATPTGCAGLPFEPTFSAVPTTAVAESPTGLVVDLHIPQSDDPGLVGEADLKDAVVRLPPGLTVNPSSANGLEGCTPGQIGLTTPVGTASIHTTPRPAECPDGAKIGTVEVDTPLLDHPLSGAVYIASPYENPFHSLLAIYIAVDDPESGIVVKLAGHVEIGADGQLTTRFEENPQLPFEDFKLKFFDGPRAALKTGAVCGAYTTTSSLTPWSEPESGPPATPGNGFRIGSQPGGGICPTSADQQPNNPAFSAGSESPFAGAYTPFVLHLRRDDGTQHFSSLTVTPPPGLLGKLAGIPYCSDAALAVAGGRNGKDEQAAPSCPPASGVGAVIVGAGAGPQPYYVQGRAYLAGPYKGAPLSLAIITPAVAGPYDLGTVVVRSALEVDPFSAQITVKSDPIPTELKGIPLDVRSIAVRMGRSGFTLNPTNCEAMALGASVTTTVGQTAVLGSPFQVGSCKALKFKPKLKVRLKGSTNHAGHPALKAVVTYPKKGAYANIARAQVNLPHSEFLDQGNLNKTCTKPVLLEGRCPKSTVYGRVKAWTPLLARPLKGHVYLVGGFGYKLPALIAELNGQIRILLKGKVDSGKNKGIRSTFEAVPDAPVSRFVLEMKGGKKYGLLENSENLCRKTQRGIARFRAQNGRVLQWKPRIANDCGRKRKRKKEKRKNHAKTMEHAKGKKSRK